MASSERRVLGSRLKRTVALGRKNGSWVTVTKQRSRIVARGTVLRSTPSTSMPPSVMSSSRSRDERKELFPLGSATLLAHGGVWWIVWQC